MAVQPPNGQRLADGVHLWSQFYGPLCGGDLASTEVRARGMHAERHRLVNPVENQRNCGHAACSRSLITCERLSGSSPVRPDKMSFQRAGERGAQRPVLMRNTAAGRQWVLALLQR